MAEKIVKDSQGLAKDLVNDCISRYGVAAWLDNMGYTKLAYAVMDKDRFPSVHPEKRTEERTEKHACDCISKTAAIDQLHQSYNLLDAEQRLEDLPSAQPYTDEDIQKMQDIEQAQLDKAYEMGKADALRWVPCSERLPEEDTEVLISYRYKEGEGDTDHVNIDITSYGTVCFGGREIHTLKEWRQPFDYFHANYEVIAWMPLPTPYREE